MKISIITVAYNCGATIADCIQSVDRQTYSNWEHWVIDGASTDATLEIVDQYRDSRRHVQSEPDEGIYDAMNKGISCVTGEVVGILNADDLFADPEVLMQVAALFQEKDVDLVYGDLVYVAPDQTDRVVRYWKSGFFRKQKMLYGWMPPHPTVFVRRELYEQSGGFRKEFRCSGDYEMMVRLLYKAGVKAHYLPRVLVRMRTGGVSNNSLQNRWTANQEDRIAWKVNGLRPYFFTTWMKPLRKIGQFLFTGRGHSFL
jgi:glycosyltransferase involved in cell wall biosynthesis